MSSRRKSAEELLALARELRLTEKQRLFAEAFFADPRRNKTFAATKAGSKRPAEAGCRWARDAKVLQYMTALEAQGMLRTEEQAAQELAQTPAAQRAIADRDEALQFQTTVMRSRLGDFVLSDGTVSIDSLRSAPAGLVRRYRTKAEKRFTTSGDGVKIERDVEHVDFELESALTASANLIRHYDGQSQQAAPTIWIEKLLLMAGNGNGQGKLLAEVYDQVLGGNGNGVE